MEHGPFEWQAPVIINGAGRSGSTLLSGILEAHPEINAVGETAYLLARLWHEYFAKPNYVDEYRNRRLILDSQPEWRELSWMQLLQNPPGDVFDSKAFLASVQKTERPRIAALLGRFVAESLIPPGSRRRYWSFQEIWNVAHSFPYGWDIYHMAFPAAKYLHIVRNPRTWLPSYLRINSQQPSRENCLNALREWVQINETSLANAHLAERYLLVRYEDLIADMRAGIRRLLSFVGVEDHPRCHEAAGYRYQPGESAKIDLPHLTTTDLESIPGLYPLLTKFAYPTPWPAQGA